MRAVYKRELRALLCGLTAPLVLAVALCIIGIYTAVLSFSQGYANFEIVLSNTTYILLVLIPLLSMRMFADEPRLGTDKLLHSLPLRVTDVVLGKYLAAVTVYGALCVVLCGYPWLLSRYGATDLATAYSAIAGDFLLGCALLAVGAFCSSMTENPVVAAVFTFGLSFLSYLLPTVSDYLASSGLAAFVLFTFAIAALSVLVCVCSKKPLVAAAVGASLEIPLAVLLLLDSSLLDCAVQRVLSACALFSRLDPFVYGMFDLGGVVYYLGAAFLFLFFTVLHFERPVRTGAFHIALTALACVCVFSANLLTSALPADWTRFDTTTTGLFTLSDTSREFLSSLDRDVTVYLLAGAGSEDEGMTEIIRQAQSACARLRFETRDPVLYPYFSSAYTTLSLAENSIIVVGPDRSTAVDFSELYVADTLGTGYFNGESALINAVRYVTSDALPVIYTLTGHGELSVADDPAETLIAQGFDLQTLNLLTRGSVPENAALVLILSPAADLTEPETERLEQYLASGGRVLLCTDMLAVSTPNLDALTASMGLCALDGLIVEGDPDSRLSDYPSYLLPTLGSHDISSALHDAGYRVLLPVAHAVTTVAAPDGALSFSALLYTSESAYRKEDVLQITTLDRETGDETGVWNLGIAAENADTGARMVWFGSSMLLDSTVNDAVSGANFALFANSALWLSSQETTLAISARSLVLDTVLMSEQDARLWNAVCVYFVPLGILLSGFAVWGSRRKQHKKKGVRRK